ncbi:MAG: RDD family protein [Longicatena sp.]
MSSKLTSLYFKLYSITDHTPCDVDHPKRIWGYILDWVIGGILTGLPAVFMYGGVTGRNDMFSDLYVFQALGFSKSYGVIAGILCILCAMFYYIYVPLKIYPGQTLGKHLAGFKIVKKNNEPVDLKTLVVRQVLGIFLIEGAALIVSNYIRQLISLSFNFYVDYHLALIGMVITLISVILVIKTDSHRALHDYLAKTKLVLVEAKESDATSSTTKEKVTPKYKNNKKSKKR